MRMLYSTLLCVTVVLAPVGCTRQEAVATGPDTSQADATQFEVTPAIAATTGVTVVVGVVLLGIIACGIACAQ